MAHIDTLKAYEDLIESGVSANEAKAQVKLLDTSFDRFATKDDLANAVTRLEMSTKNDILSMKNDLQLTFGLELFAIFAAILFLPMIERGWFSFKKKAAI